MELLKKQSDTIKLLSADMVQKANSGHPGAPMGLSDIVTILSRKLNHNPKNPKWLNRDRLVFSGGHASALVYSFLHLSGYDLSLDDLKNFRQLNSNTPGHPEYGEVVGVEVTTGPLGQGVANAVGFAMAEKYAKNLLNSDECKIIDHKVYCLCGDGDLQEGISYEACSLAGVLNLDNLVLIYDSNHITIEGNTAIAWNEDVKVRFEAAGWEVARIDGHSFDEIEFALDEAKNKTKPYLIIASTTIAKGADKLEGSHESHGAPLGDSEIKAAKEKAGFDPNLSFYIDEEVKKEFLKQAQRGEKLEQEWNQMLENAPIELKSKLANLQNPDFSKINFPDFKGKKIATRDSNGEILQDIARAVDGFLGGSADLAPSNKTTLKGFGEFPQGRNIHFGIREHAMGAITNAFALYGLFLPFCATFFIFSDYLKPAFRLSALMSLKNFFIFTHDSIGVGEDGPTHQPVEQLSTLRAIPNSYTFRPADGVENVKCWQKALSLNAPSAFVLSRQKLANFDGKSDFGDVENGGYLVEQNENATITLIASGSELGLAKETLELLKQENIIANLVSVPCFELFAKQDESYIKNIIKPQTKALAIEAGSGDEWYRFADEVFGMKSFGASAKAEDLFVKFGFSASNLAQIAKAL